MTEVERHAYDVVVIGAGGAGLRAVIEARERGLKVAVVSKSLFGKAHTVMAEGGCAASMGNTNPKDNWSTHFGDTMRGGKFLNNWRMAELHAKEAPDRVWELETYGALFDRHRKSEDQQRRHIAQHGSDAFRAGQGRLPRQCPAKRCNQSRPNNLPRRQRRRRHPQERRSFAGACRDE